MGIESSLEGSIEIHPAPRFLDYSLEKLQAAKGVNWGWECIKVHFEKESVHETEEDGTEVIRTRVVSAEIRACGCGGHKHYTVTETLQAIVDMLGADRDYNGYFEYHNELGDMRRYAIVQGVARQYEPKIVWPEEVQ